MLNAFAILIFEQNASNITNALPSVQKTDGNTHIVMCKQDVMFGYARRLLLLQTLHGGVSADVLADILLYAPDMFVSSLANMQIDQNSDGAIQDTLERMQGKFSDKLNRRGETLLHVAVRVNRMDAVEALVEGGVKIHAKDTHGRTAFMYACANKYLNLMSCLIDSSTKEHSKTRSQYAAVVQQVEYTNGGSSSTSIFEIPKNETTTSTSSSSSSSSSNNSNNSNSTNSTNSSTSTSSSSSSSAMPGMDSFTYEIAKTPRDWIMGNEWQGAYETCSIIKEDRDTYDVCITSDGAICKDVMKMYVRLQKQDLLFMGKALPRGWKINTHNKAVDATGRIYSSWNQIHKSHDVESLNRSPRRERLTRQQKSDIAQQKRNAKNNQRSKQIAQALAITAKQPNLNMAGKTNARKFKTFDSFMWKHLWGHLSARGWVKEDIPKGQDSVQPYYLPPGVTYRGNGMKNRRDYWDSGTLVMKVMRHRDKDLWETCKVAAEADADLHNQLIVVEDLEHKQKIMQLQEERNNAHLYSSRAIELTLDRQLALGISDKSPSIEDDDDDEEDNKATKEATKASSSSSSSSSSSTDAIEPCPIVVDRDIEGNTPMHYATEVNAIDCVQLLLSKGASVTKLSKFHGSALQLVSIQSDAGAM